MATPVACVQQAASLNVLISMAGACHRADSVPMVQSSRACAQAVPCEDECGPRVSRRRVLLSGPGLALAAGAVAAATAGFSPAGSAAMPEKIFSEWEQVSVPVDAGVDLLDVAFVPGDWDHGFLIGTQKTLLETRDGGRSWSRCQVPDGLGDRDTFAAIKFADLDGWIIGEPSVLVYTRDGGSNWKHIPLDLEPCEIPLSVEAFGAGRAELVTTNGAVCVTDDGGVSWTPKVSRSQAGGDRRAACATTLSGELCRSDRSSYGEYVAVSSEANSYLTWTPDQPWWQSHEDSNFSRIKNVGWFSDGDLWLTSQEGGLYFASGPKELAEFQECKTSIQGLGIQDISFRTRYEAWAAGTGGLLLRTFDGGETWMRDLLRKDFSTDLYRIRFVDYGKGFIMGEGGILFRHLLYKRRLQYLDVGSLRTVIKASEAMKELRETQNL